MVLLKSKALILVCNRLHAVCCCLQSLTAAHVHIDGGHILAKQAIDWPEANAEKQTRLIVAAIIASRSGEFEPSKSGAKRKKGVSTRVKLVAYNLKNAFALFLIGNSQNEFLACIIIDTAERI